MSQTNLAYFPTPDSRFNDERAQEIELSIVMPCLNEARTLPDCIARAANYLRTSGVSGEIIVADNGSTDGSQELARSLGARVVPVTRRGYGAALRGGIAAARGTFVIMGDSDSSYDFSALEPFVQKLRQGSDLVLGNRFKGGIQQEAMPFLHRYLGNPVLSWLGRLFFESPCGDFYCGLRGFRRDAIKRLKLRSEGMEFALEMVIKASMCKLKVSEVPTTLAPDGRDRAPHLRTWRDGWRSLRLYLWFSPRWLFWYPGWLLLLGGTLVALPLLAQPRMVLGISLDVHTLLYAAGAIVLGVQSILFAVLAKYRAVQAGLHPSNRYFEAFIDRLSLEGGLGLGSFLFLSGLCLSAYTTNEWSQTGFGTMDPFETMRLVIPAVLAMLLGAQLALFSFFFSLLNFECLTQKSFESNDVLEEQKFNAHLVPVEGAAQIVESMSVGEQILG